MSPAGAGGWVASGAGGSVASGAGASVSAGAGAGASVSAGAGAGASVCTARAAGAQALRIIARATKTLNTIMVVLAFMAILLLVCDASLRTIKLVAGTAPKLVLVKCLGISGIAVRHGIYAGLGI